MPSRSQMIVESARTTVDALDAAQRSISDAARSLSDAARSIGHIEAHVDAGDDKRIDDAAPLLREVLGWLEDRRDEADRADRVTWQEKVLQLGQAMAILRVPLYKDV